MRYIRIGRLAVQTPLGAWLCFVMQPGYEASCHIRVENKNKLITIGSSCPLDSDPKFPWGGQVADKKKKFFMLYSTFLTKMIFSSI